MTQTKEAAVVAKIEGAFVTAHSFPSAQMYEVVRIGSSKLIGEIIQLQGDEAEILVYEDTTGIRIGDPIELTGKPLCAELGPGILESVYDAFQRPFKISQEKSGDFTVCCVGENSLDQTKKWGFVPSVSEGEVVSEGDILGTVQETPLVIHNILVPVGIKNATVEKIQSGHFRISDIVAVLDKKGKKSEVTLRQYWPIRTPRKIRQKHIPADFLETGICPIDTFFPFFQGSVACISGGSGAGKSFLQQTIAQQCNAQVLIYVGCGMGGNEVSEFFQKLQKPRDARGNGLIMPRAVFIAQTPDMPMPAREVSVYLGMTIAEYYRDMGYSVALFVDSVSRWREMKQEFSKLISETSFKSKISEFCERAGAVDCLGSHKRTGSLSLTVISSGLDDSISKSILRIADVSLHLNSAIKFEASSSSLASKTGRFVWENIASDAKEIHEISLNLIREGRCIQKRGGISNVEEKIILVVSEMIFDRFFFQDRFSENTFVSPRKQYQMLKTIVHFYLESTRNLDKNDFDFDAWRRLPSVQKIHQMHLLSEKNEEAFEKLRRDISREV